MDVTQEPKSTSPLSGFTLPSPAVWTPLSTSSYSPGKPTKEIKPTRGSKRTNPGARKRIANCYKYRLERSGRPSSYQVDYADPIIVQMRQEDVLYLLQLAEPAAEGGHRKDTAMVFKVHVPIHRKSDNHALARECISFYHQTLDQNTQTRTIAVGPRKFRPTWTAGVLEYMHEGQSSSKSDEGQNWQRDVNVSSFFLLNLRLCHEEGLRFRKKRADGSDEDTMPANKPKGPGEDLLFFAGLWCAGKENVANGSESLTVYYLDARKKDLTFFKSHLKHKHKARSTAASPAGRADGMKSVDNDEHGKGNTLDSPHQAVTPTTIANRCITSSTNSKTLSRRMNSDSNGAASIHFRNVAKPHIKTDARDSKDMGQIALPCEGCVRGWMIVSSEGQGPRQSANRRRMRQRVDDSFK
ncbi:hypothetical protein DFJ77DRAFT_441523 [Powellomyces hirtus]|nr:hypothetical protein DFJ77DRAFT_441523 [Powellomyces hirtus]